MHEKAWCVHEYYEVETDQSIKGKVKKILKR